MKKRLQHVLQRLLGFERYLVVFSVFKILTLKIDKKENDFFKFLEMLPEGGTVLDVGANIGIMTVHISQSKAVNEVIAFEPIPENFQALTSVCERFGLGNVRLYNFALGEEEGEVKMLMPERENVKMQGLSHVEGVSEEDQEVGEFYTVPVKTLDLFLGDTTQRITGIKMDVENYEQFVLRGAKKLLQKHRPIVYCELWANVNREACFDFMKSIDYDIKVWDSSSLIPFEESNYTGQNFFFTART